MKKWWVCVAVGHEIFSVQRCPDLQFRNQTNTLSTSGKISANAPNSKVCELNSKMNSYFLHLLRTNSVQACLYIYPASWGSGSIFCR